MTRQNPSLDEDLVILAIGAHPDDIDFGCSATLAKLAEQGPMFTLSFVPGATAEAEITGFFRQN